ncbi:hypothetical protein PF005_g19358 [Phytophthora fragariae]|uniref:Uncharacterized protein n=1 Tax=Phytophthora fragariae TaxID=53985 RepID=A0A6A3EXE6_9STRA|nr:hypothetical protein PF003_g37953 [Phytophthora fragariae]KAE8937363.1 hypothetical protein PF009_g12730 [Phytophthora fragariae]KAE9095718.1 hypothetical protein PF010_g16605 [Phytophthora fragariae]KAE9109560.1 hypothetical protein PF007_g12199 [Phytophthora fragariae]KAE9129296.1 hypothetical protein PF006_g16054 [Phytophthora fragariae]
MKIFLVGGFALDPRADGYNDQVLDAGHRADGAVLALLKSQNINAKGAGSVLRALRPLRKSGVLDERTVAYKRLITVGSIVDPAPADTQDILASVDQRSQTLKTGCPYPAVPYRGSDSGIRGHP